MTGHLQTLIESFISQPDCRLAEVNMLTARERRWLIEERNQTEATDAADLCAHQLFERAAHGFGQRVEVECGCAQGLAAAEGAQAVGDGSGAPRGLQHLADVLAQWFAQAFFESQ